MAEETQTALHITINKAGDPEKLGELLKAAMAAQEKKVMKIVPKGYHCVECYSDDGGHTSRCSIGAEVMTAQARGESL